MAAEAGGGAGGEKLPRGPIPVSRAATLFLQRREKRPAGWAAEPESGTGEARAARPARLQSCEPRSGADLPLRLALREARAGAAAGRLRGQ